MKRILLAFVLMTSSAYAAPNQTACRDCPFPFTLQCRADKNDPGSYSCQPAKRNRFPTMRAFHCMSDPNVPIPLKCKAEQ
jgi:hypothetical protein